MSEIISIDTGNGLQTATKITKFEPFKLVAEDSEILRNVVPEYDFDKESDSKELSERLIETIKLHRAFGLAAPQCGVSKRVFVIGAEDEYIVMFNPEILSSSIEETHMEEGCLSFPFMFLSITRPKQIFVKYQNKNGENKEIKLDGISAKVFQHELDHLNGITFQKRAKPLALKMATKRREKQIKKFARELLYSGMLNPEKNN